MASSPQITVRVDPELYKALVMLARTEEKTLANFTRDLIEDGLEARKSTKSAESPEILERLDAILQLLKAVHDEPADLIEKAVRAAAAGQSYARQAAVAAQDIASIWGDQIAAAESSESRREALGKMDADSQDFAQWWVKHG